MSSSYEEDEDLGFLQANIENDLDEVEEKEEEDGEFLVDFKEFGKDLKKITSIPLFLKKSFSFLLENAHSVEGLFRKVPENDDYEKIKKNLLAGKLVNMETEVKKNAETIHIWTKLIKQYFKQLPVPIFPFYCFKVMTTIGRMENRINRIEILKIIMNNFLPMINRDILELLFNFLWKLAKRSSRMNAHNLGIVFSPNLFRSKNKFDMIQYCEVLCTIVTTGIEDYDILFQEETPREKTVLLNLLSNTSDEMSHEEIMQKLEENIVLYYKIPKEDSTKNAVMGKLKRNKATRETFSTEQLARIKNNLANSKTTKSLQNQVGGIRTTMGDNRFEKIKANPDRIKIIRQLQKKIEPSKTNTMSSLSLPPTVRREKKLIKEKKRKSNEKKRKSNETKKNQKQKETKRISKGKKPKRTSKGKRNKKSKNVFKKISSKFDSIFGSTSRGKDMDDLVEEVEDVDFSSDEEL